MTQFFTLREQVLSPVCIGEGRHDGVFGDTARGGNGATAEPGEAIAIAVGHFLDQSKLTQAPEVSRYAGRPDLG